MVMVMVGLSAFAVTRATGQVSGAVVRACAEPYGDGSSPTAGLMHALISGGTCPDGWRTMSWSSTGAEGPAGFAGPRGPDSAVGPKGPRGVAGANALGYVDQSARAVMYRPMTGELRPGGFDAFCPAGYKVVGFGFDTVGNPEDKPYPFAFGGGMSQTLVRPLHPQRGAGVNLTGNFNRSLEQQVSAGPLCWDSR